jgi:hypothetical protein
MVHMIAQRRAVLVAICASVILAVGCGGDSLGRQPLSGKVSVNGAPLERGTVNFQPIDKGIGSGARIEGGKYAIARKDGLPAGKYRVVINAPTPGSAPAASDAPPGEPPPPPQELIPEEWNTKSEHTIDISSGKNEHNFDVQTKKK